MKNHRFWLILFGLILAGGITGSLWVIQEPAGGIVEIRQDGAVLYRLALADYQASTTIAINCPGGINTILLENGRICMLSADCPDQTCVKRGWLDSSAPIVCLPHRLVIQYTSAEDKLDALTS